MKKWLLFNVFFLLLLTSCQISNNNYMENSNSSIEKTAGTFFDLDSTFNNNMITDNQLMNICYRNNYNHLYEPENEEHPNVNLKEIEVNEEAIIPIEPMSDDSIIQIRHDYYLSIKDDEYFSIEKLDENDVQIGIYCGCYNGYYAIRFKELKNRPDAEEIVKVGNYYFRYPNIGGEKVVLWKITQD